MIPKNQHIAADGEAVRISGAWIRNKVSIPLRHTSWPGESTTPTAEGYPNAPPKIKIK